MAYLKISPFDVNIDLQSKSCVFKNRDPSKPKINPASIKDSGTKTREVVSKTYLIDREDADNKGSYILAGTWHGQQKHW